MRELTYEELYEQYAKESAHMDEILDKLEKIEKKLGELNRS